MDRGMLTGMVFLDIRKAFSSVDHTLLLDKLQMYGIKDQALSWFILTFVTGHSVHPLLVEHLMC